MSTQKNGLEKISGQVLIPAQEQSEEFVLTPAIAGLTLLLNNLLINLLAFGALFVWYFSVPWIVIIGWSMLGLGGVCVFLRLFTITCFSISAETGVLLKESCLFFSRKVPFSARQDILVIGVTGRFQKTDMSEWYEYAPCFVDNKGQTFPLSGYLKEAFEQADQQAKNIAAILQVPYAPGVEKQFLRLTMENSGKYLVDYDAKAVFAKQRKTEIGLFIFFLFLAAVLYLTTM